MYFPGTYDTFGASHQVMHIAVLGAAIVYGLGIKGQIEFLHSGS